MNCTKYNDLTPLEKATFIGKLSHAAMSNDILFDMCSDLIEIAEEKGCFDRVKFMPENNVLLNEVY